MRHIPFTSFLAVLISLAPASAQPEPTERVADELAGIRRTLSRLVQLLEAAEGRHEAELLLRRIELMERRIAPLQGRVSEAQGEVHGLENEIRRLRGFEAELDARIDEAIRDGTDRADSDDRTTMSQVRAELKRLLEQLEVAELRKRQAEDALADARDEIEVLDDTLLEMLEKGSGNPG